MKTRSKALYQYLSQANVLSGTKEDIILAKQAYRKEYKRQWKRAKKPTKEIRIGVTLRQYGIIRLKSCEYQERPTVYCRNVILAAAGIRPHIAHRDALLSALQLVSMAAIGASGNRARLCEISDLLARAETILLNYLENPT
ncbi:MAG: hypothetical protein ABIN91_19130 [Mucilaginibacter sp.]|uniref:hypothetical protein n=1 Tax=Mucilaginibacter sp. TaxID=1882438 RepID=UPI003267CE93